MKRRVGLRYICLPSNSLGQLLKGKSKKQSFVFVLFLFCNDYFWHCRKKILLWFWLSRVKTDSGIYKLINIFVRFAFFFFSSFSFLNNVPLAYPRLLLYFFDCHPKKQSRSNQQQQKKFKI